MTVKELIEELQEAPDNATVLFERDGIPVGSVLWVMKPDGDESRIVGGDAGMSELKPWPFCGGSNVRHIEEIPGYLDKKPKYRHCPRCSAKVVNR